MSNQYSETDSEAGRRSVEVAVIGAGSAGLAAATEIGKQTNDFVLIDPGPLGTSCARVACMPSKALIEVADAAMRQRLLEGLTVDGETMPRLDSRAVMARVRRLRDDFAEGMKNHTLNFGDRLVSGRAHFEDPATLNVDGTIIKAGKTVIATGSEPIVPTAWQKFRDRIITTDELFELEELPRRLAVVGLGPAGLELGQALAWLGVTVIGIEATAAVGGLTDPQVNAAAVKAMRADFAIHPDTRAELTATDKGVAVTFADESHEVERVLVTVGRRPRLAGLGLDRLGIATDERGVPELDPATMQIKGLPIYLAGDANAGRPLLHEAVDEGHIAGYNAARPQDTCFKRRSPLAIVFSEPNIAMVGQRFSELEKGRFVIGSSDFSHQSRARMAGRNRGLLHLYAAADSGRLLGAEMAVPAGEHLAHLLALAIEAGFTVADLLQMPFYHPAVEEGLQSACRSAYKQLDLASSPTELLRCESAAADCLA